MGKSEQWLLSNDQKPKRDRYSGNHANSFSRDRLFLVERGRSGCLIRHDVRVVGLENYQCKLNSAKDFANIILPRTYAISISTELAMW